MESLLKEDVRWCVRLLGEKVELAVRQTGVVVAGGFIRSAIAREEINDIDLFPLGTALAPEAVQAVVCSKLHPNSKHSRDPHRTPNAVTIHCQRTPVQVVHRWKYDTPEQLVLSFDYTIARAAIWWNSREEKWHSICDARFYQDLAAKRLVYNAPKRDEEAGGSMLRLLKFYQRGYRAPLDTVALVAQRWLQKIDPAIATNTPEWQNAALRLLVEVDPSADPARDGHF